MHTHAHTHTPMHIGFWLIFIFIHMHRIKKNIKNHHKHVYYLILADSLISLFNYRSYLNYFFLPLLSLRSPMHVSQGVHSIFQDDSFIIVSTECDFVNLFCVNVVLTELYFPRSFLYTLNDVIKTGIEIIKNTLLLSQFQTW